MTRFEEIYLRIINEMNSISNAEPEFIDYNNIEDTYSIITEDTISIINEYVKDPELTPIPKDFLNVICSRVKYRRDNVTIISMKELYELLREYEYPFYNDFKDSLKTFSGNLYIVMLFDRDFNFYSSPYFNKTFSFVNHYIKNTNVCTKICNELLKNKHKNVDAFCSKTDNDLKNNEFFQNNGLIFISLKGEFIKDSLEHELTHFVQKTVGFNKTEQQIKQSNKFNNFINCDNKSAEHLIKWLKEYITENDFQLSRLMQFFGVKFNSNELHQSIKAVLNGIQRIYEYGKLSYISELDFSKNEINKEESNKNLQFRLNWLNSFLLVINSNKFIENNLKPVILNLFKEEEQQEYLIKNRPYFIILLYFGFKIMFKDLKIDEKLKTHFNSFNFKDN